MTVIDDYLYGPNLYAMEPAHFVIIDDDAINNRLCQLCIARHFGDVPIQSYQNADFALHSISTRYNEDSFLPTVILLDIYMPTVSGWEFLEKFNAFPQSIKNQFKIFMLSASTDQTQIDRANRHPLVSAFLTKPLTEDKLERVFRDLPEDYGLRCFR